MTFGGSVAQSSVVPALSLGGMLPDFPFILTILLALRKGPEIGCLVGFGAGFLQDVAGGGLLGVQALTRALVGFLTGVSSARLLVGNPLVQIPAIVVFTLVEGVLRFWVLQLFHYPAPLERLVTHVIVPQALYNGVVGAACVLALGLADVVRPRLIAR
jgi:rod shape-determining protein MreD